MRQPQMTLPLDLTVGLVAKYNSVRVNTLRRSLSGYKQPGHQRNLVAVLFSNWGQADGSRAHI
jgi:hypothetical protein